MKKLLKKLLPPLLIEFYQKLKGQNIQWTGSYPDWEKAQASCDGYDSEIILQNVLSATRQTCNNPDLCERDGVILSQRKIPWQVLSCLLHRAKQNQRLHVVDFGGSLGSLWHLLKPWFTEIPDLRWAVVEQSHFVKAGQEEFNSENIHFFCTVDEALHWAKPDTLLLSSVLQYLPHPFETLNPVIAHFESIIIDRTPLQDSSINRICKQSVPAWIYKSSYPCHIFAKNSFLSYFQGFELSPLEFWYNSDTTNDQSFYFAGVYWIRQDKKHHAAQL